jgi:hypothetical protein
VAGVVIGALEIGDLATSWSECDIIACWTTRCYLQVKVIV